MANLIARLVRSTVIAGVLIGSATATLASSLSGSYLAAMQADFRNEYATAADYYGRALADDPENIGLLQNAMASHVALGDIAAALPLAERFAAVEPKDQLSALVRISDAIKQGDFAEAAEILAGAGDQINPLLGGLLAGWLEVGRDDFTAAQGRFDAMVDNEVLAAYGQYHKALALALAGDFISAQLILAGGEDGPLHLSRSALIAHAQILAQIDRESDAIALIDSALVGAFPDATLIDLRDQLAAGEEVPFTQITDARDGAAEAFYTIAEALVAQETGRFALIHARLAAHTRPDLIEARILAAEILESQEQYLLATEALSKLPPDSPWYVIGEIRRANTQRASGDAQAGIATLASLRTSHADQIAVQSALGDALRVAERYAESAEAYSRAVALIDEPQPVHWVLYHSRAVAYERTGDWTGAEADFRQALSLEPDQPVVLNYLGYSLVERGENLDEALGMIERAVVGQPDDGYITDSLGWVLYRLGRYDEAVAPMLRAVELTPDDPVINDHLGDVLWKVGRTREAEFQWRRALSFGPADDLDMERIRRKLDEGLDAVLASDKAANDG